MNKNSSSRNKLFWGLSAATSLAILTGCAQFHEKSDNQKEAWARQQGDKTLTVQGYSFNDGKNTSCFEKGFKAAIIPNDDYAKKYVKFLIKTDRDPLFRTLSPEAQALVRYTNWQHKCVYKFDNLPAGNWIVVFDVQNSIMPLITVATDMGPATKSTIASGDTFIWAPVEINPDDKDLKKKLVFNQAIPQQDTILNFQWKDNVSVHEGKLLDWDAIPDEPRN
ncbi:hypothetical protein PT277_05450 [Acetobacteraceae bacterium ESL0709]|nr:hypothetical protein [Acetobacteraceae bacterium ESL0697]MDF7678141.1 hypothetical protein [Acetobacteraceae bacterium ESL0709]